MTCHRNRILITDKIPSNSPSSNLNLLRKLLSHNINALQLAGFALANLLGMMIVVLAVQFFFDVRPLFKEGDGLMAPTRIVVAKHISSLRTVTKTPPSFTDEDIEDLRRQPFAERVDAFVSSQYEVIAAVGIQSMGATFSTEMFFEAVPDECIDIDRSRWVDDASSDTLPIILPKNYLNLYNFGYAGARGMPTFSENIVGRLPIRLLLTGPLGEWRMTGKVVGFSKRLNTILVPMAFMQRANSELTGTEPLPPSRLIVTVKNPADERIAAYLSENNYETETSDDDTSRTAGMMRWIIIAVLAIGLCITALAFYVLLLSIFLLLQKHTEKIDTLLLGGYPIRVIARFYHRLALWLNLIIMLISVGIALWIRHTYISRFTQWYERYEVPSPLPLIIAAIVLFVVVCTLNVTAIRRKVKGIWYIHR